MSLSSAGKRELFALLHGLRDAQLSGEQSVKLREAILADDDALALYLDHAFLMARLHWAHGGFCEIAAEAVPVGDSLPSPERKSRRDLSAWARRTPRFVALAASLALVGYFVAVATLLLWDRFHRADDRPQLAAERSTEPLAQLIRSDDASWPSADANQPKTLRVRSGLARLKFAKGAEIVVQGPAEFEVRSPNAGFLRHGKLLAKVPAAAVGFTIETTTAKVVDLGTEFGVIADESGEIEVNVLQGRVSVQLVARDRLSSSEAFVVRAGEAKRIRADGTMDVASVTSSGVWSRLAGELPRQRAERRVFPDGLVAYWALDESDEPIQDSVGISHGEPLSGHRVLGLIGRGALRSGKSSGQLAEIYGCEAPGTFSQALSVEALFVSSWSGKSGDYDYICRKQRGTHNLLSLAFKNDERDAVEGPLLAFEIVTDHGRKTLELPLDGREGRPSLASLTDGKRHHAAATFNGVSGEMAIYIDGVPRMVRAVTPSLLLSGDDQSVEAAETPAPNFDDPFSGVLDEIAVYRVALSPHEIAVHWKNVSQGRSYFARP